MKKRCIIASVLAVISLGVGSFALTAPAFADDQLTIVSWGGAYQTMLRKAFFEPFTKDTGIKVIEDVWNAETSKVRAMVDTKTVTWDVVGIGAGIRQMCDQGLIETIDWKRLGLDPAKFGEAGKQTCGLPMHTTAIVVAYDKDKLPDGPKTIADLFDTKKFPGKRALQNRALSNIEWALIADGVPTKDVYKVLNTPEGIDRAFKKLDTIKKDVVWWTSWSQPAQLLSDGQVVMAASGQSAIYDANKNSGKHLEIMWDAPLLALDFWVIPKGSPHLDAAYKFLAFFGTAQAQASITHYMPLSPANKDALALVDPAMEPYLASSHMGNALAFDTAFWNEKGGELNERFAAWLAK